MADFEEDIADSAAPASQQSDKLYGDYYPSEPTQNMSNKPGYEMEADGMMSDQQEHYTQHSGQGYVDEDSQYSFQRQQYELEQQQHQQQQQQFHHDIGDEAILHDEFTGSGGLVHGKGDYYDEGEEDDLPANFNRNSQEVPQTEDLEQPRSFEDYPEDMGGPLSNSSGGIPYDESGDHVTREEQQVVPGSNVFDDDERPIMGSYNNPFLPNDDSPQQQEMPQDFGDVPQQQQYQEQQNSDDEEDDTIDEVHPAEAQHGYDRLEEDPQYMNDISGDIDEDDADIVMDPVDNVQFEERQERQDQNEMEYPHAGENDLVSGGFNPTTLEEPIQAASSAPGVESSAATVPEEDFDPDEVEERMVPNVAGAVESGVPSQMMLDDQEDDEDKENAVPQREDEFYSHRADQVESEPTGMAAAYEETVGQERGVKDEDDENDDYSEAGVKDDKAPTFGAAEVDGLDNPAFAEDDMQNVLDNRKLEQITEFEDVETEKLQGTQSNNQYQEEDEEEQFADDDRFADDADHEPVSEQFSSQAFTSDLESTPNTPGFVDNLSDLASPAEVIPQPLPSPPEPRDGISPFDPLEDRDDRDSPYDKYKDNEGDEYANEFTREEPISSGPGAEQEESDAGILPATSAGGAGSDDLIGYGGACDSGSVPASLLQQDGSTAGGAADFLTGEVEGETTFGVDGTAATTLTETTAPTAEIINTGGQENAGFLNLDDEEEEEEDESQLMDHGIGEAGDGNTTTTTTTTTTEDASDDITGTGMEQEGATDNALMSMSMEGSFYDDGGDVMGGGDDQGRGQGVGGMNHLSNSMYHPDPITEESASQPSSYDQRNDGFLSSQADDQNFSQDLMQTSTDVADNILGDREVEQQYQQSNADLLSDVPVTTAQDYSSNVASTFEGLGDDMKQQEDAAAAEEEAQLRQMEEQLRLEEEQMRQEEEIQRQEEERQRQLEEQRKLEEEQRLREEQLRQEEEDRLRQEEEEEERLRLEEEQLRQEEERLRQEEEEERIRQEEERLRKEEEMRLHEEERLRQEEDERRRQEEEEAEERRLEAERQQIQAEEEERRRIEEEQIRQAEEQQRLQEEQLRQAEEQHRIEEEQRRLQEEEQERARQEELVKATASETQASVDISVTEAPADATAQPDNSSSVDAPVKVEEQPAAAAAPDTTAEAAPAAAVAAAAPVIAAAAAASPEKKATSKIASKTSTPSSATKKSATSTSKTAAPKTASTPSTKTTPKTTTKPATNGRPASATAKKTETTTKTPPSSAGSASRKPFDNRPITALERKAAAAKPSPTTSAARPTSTSKSNAPLPSYAQPITPRKPREAKVLSPEEKKKATTGGRTPSASARTPRPQSSTTTSATRTTSATTTTTSATRTSSATTKSAASSGASSPTKTPTTARPKSSPTKLSNGTASDTKPFTARPAPKTTTTPRSAPAAAKTSTPGSAGAKSSPRASASTTPRTPATPKTTEARSKIGSLDKAAHTPGGGNVKITTKKTDYTNVTSRVGSKDKMDHKPGGGQVKIENRKLKVEAKSKIGSLDNAAHKPTGGDKKIESHKLDFKEKASPKIGSLDKTRLNSGGEGDEEPLSDLGTEIQTNGDGAAQAL